MRLGDYSYPKYSPVPNCIPGVNCKIEKNHPRLEFLMTLWLLGGGGGGYGPVIVSHHWKILHTEISRLGLVSVDDFYMATDEAYRDDRIKQLVSEIRLNNTTAPNIKNTKQDRIKGPSWPTVQRLRRRKLTSFTIQNECTRSGHIFECMQCLPRDQTFNILTFLRFL